MHAGSMSTLLAECEQLADFVDAEGEELQELRQQMQQQRAQHGEEISAPLTSKALEFVLGSFSNPSVCVAFVFSRHQY